MKKLSTLILVAAMCGSALQLTAQISTPAASPFSKVEQEVGLTDVTIEYSRPSAKDRNVFGELVPHGKVWRAGANSVTKITFSTDVTIGDAALKAGSYALLITPDANSWKLHFFNHDKGSWSSYIAEGAPAAAAVVSAPVKSLGNHVETWTIGLDDLRNSSAVLEFEWEKTHVGVDVSVPTETAVMTSIEKAMAGPSAGDYYSAASYYLTEGKDMNKALEWVDMSLEKGGERFWILRTKALIQAKLGDNAGAIASAKRSTELAKEAGNDEYPAMNAKSIEEWMQ